MIFKTELANNFSRAENAERQKYVGCFAHPLENSVNILNSIGDTIYSLVKQWGTQRKAKVTVTCSIKSDSAQCLL